MESPEELEALLKNAIDRFPRSSPAVNRWRSARSLFSPRAAEGLAEFIAERQSNVATVLKLQYVGPASRLASATRAKVAELASKRFRQIEKTSDSDSNLRFLRWMIKEVLTNSLPLDAIHGSVSSLIRSQSADTSDAFQQELRAFVQACPALGDPRLRENMPHWRQMESEAAQRFLSWLAKETIQFFFNTILPPNDSNRRRAEFWLRYYKQILDFQVAVSDEDLWKLKANRSTASLPLHSRVNQSATSAFLMKFQGYGSEYIIVEFSETGNAAYIYERSVFESTDVTLRTPVFDIKRHLKHDRTSRILHGSDWELSARNELAKRGIRP